MTSDNIFDIVLMLMFSGSDEKSEYEDRFISALNLTLAETFEVNNSIRVSKDLAELTAMPTVAALTDEMTYDDTLCRRVLPYGIAGLVMAEDNANMATQYKNKYEYEKSGAYKAAYTEIIDYYSGEEE